MQKMKIEYEKPEMELVLLEAFSDVITLSEGENGTPPSEDFDDMWG